MTKANSNLHRAAALLAALCLLASMALPVYAAETETEFSVSNSETIPGDDNAGNGADGTGSDISVSNLETIQKDADTTNEGSKTEPEISVPNSETITNSADTTDKAAGAPLTEGVTGSENTAPADNAAADKTAPDEEKTNLTEENTSDDEEGTADGGEDPADEAGAKETFFAADTYSEDETESDDEPVLMTASNEGGTASFIPNTATIYFAVDNTKYHENYRIKFYAQRKKDGGDRDLNRYMLDTGETIGNRKIFKVTLNQTDYPEGGFYRLIFQYYEGDTHKGEIFAFGGHEYNNNSYKWTTINQIAGKRFDGTSKDNVNNAYNDSQWTRVEYYYEGMPLYFKNASATTLNGVTATFYKKDENGNFVETGSQTIGTVEANTMAAQKITIPNNQSQFVKFTWTGGESTWYNFSKDDCDSTTKFDLVANNCFVYSESGTTGTSWTNAGSDLLTKDKTIYFDATLSSYGYDGEGLQQLPMPHKDGNMYCFLTDSSGTIKLVTMQEVTGATATNRQLWSCTVPEGGPFTAVQFSATENTGGTVADDKTVVYTTAEIPPNLKDPCFFADDGDPTAYTSQGSTVYRDGYWGNKDSVRDAESGKDTTVVDIASDTFTQEAGTKYVTSTLYDYYTDYELNGFNRDSYEAIGTHSQRWYVTFEQFDRALSSAYAANDKVQYPIYTGHFQASHFPDGMHFEDVAGGMGLYGWGNPNDGNGKYNTFMAVNNSVLDTTGKDANDEAGFARTFQGLVENKTSTGDANGLPVLKGTGSLVDPHFDKDFLQGKNTFNTVLGKVYENVAFPFTQEAVFKNNSDPNDKEAEAKYWYYDSSKSSLYLTQDKGNSKYYLKSTKDSSDKDKSVNRDAGNAEKTTTDAKGNKIKTYGFFPFNESVGTGGASQYNYGFGAKLQFDFTLTDDGQVVVGKNKDNEDIKVPIKFFFSGDDDVWVYIDGQLVLDVGGAHGKASGLLEFGKTTDGTANTVTPYVSSNKAGGIVYEDGAEGKFVYFNGSKVTFDKKGKILVEDSKVKDGKKEFTLAKGTTHTLTMFYMERGMWESNMAVAFNFPDHNELQVQKQIDVTGVNELFKDSFKNQKIFTFNIKNLATHYGEKATSYEAGTTQKLPEDAYRNAEDSSDAFASLAYVADPPNKKEGDLAVLWSATMDDPTSAHRDKRRGTLPLSTAIDISQYSYLTFDVYVEGEQTDTCALGNLYVELWDDQGHQKGCIGSKGLQSSDVYGAAIGLHPGQWYTIRLLLKSLETTSEGFNNTLQRITVGDNFARKIYLRNFTFRSAPKEQTKPGFTTEQYDIPDYKSAKSGELENATYAVFSSDCGNGGDVVDENGQFLLQADETVTFKDQFRRGSYIALKEQVDPNLYDTFWTVYENDAPVTKVSGASEYVKTDANITSLVNVKDTAPKDGRTEKVIEGKDKNGNQITNAYDDISKKKPADNTLVFRSYSDTADKDELTKLKVVFTNKVKTGKLIIRKEPATGETLAGQTFKFTVKFSDVGGQGLGGDIPEQEYPCEVIKQADGSEYGEVVIDGIPVGTRFVVSEVAHPDTNLQLVTITGGGSDRAVVDGIKARGSVVADDNNVATAKFVNTKRQLINIEVTKQWQKQDGMTAIPNKELPEAIYLKLQRTKATDGESNWTDVPGYESVELKPWYNGWVTTFTGLDKFDAEVNPHAYYTYRVLESATEKGPFYGGSEGNVIEIGGKKYTILNNTVSCADDSTTPLKLTLTNKLQDAKYNLNITKQDVEDKTKLGGVEFKLEKLKDDGTADATFPAVTRITSSEDADKGKCSFENLKPGSYRLTETKTAEGYTLLADAIEFTLTTDGECKRDATDFGDVQYDSTTGVYNIALTINNRKSFELPHTGADAPSLWLLIGLPALVAVLLVLVFRYNKKGGRRQ